MNIILIGPPGSGKTTAGQILANQTGRRFFDTDRIIESRHGVPVSEIFAKSGESEFRKIESQLLDEISDGNEWSHLVLATGGGIITTTGNFERLSKIGAVVCLLASPVCLLERLQSDESRPLLQAQNPQEREKRLLELLEKRLPLYKQAAWIIETGDLSADQVAKKIEDVLCMSDITSQAERSGIKYSDDHN